MGASEATLKAPTPQRYRRVVAFRTTEGDAKGWSRIQELALGADASGGAQAAGIFVAPAQTVLRPWLGFGGSFTEASTETLRKMSPEKRDEVLRACYDQEAGLGYKLARVHIGSCDFSLGNWTCGDLAEGDEELKGFSLEHYKASILPAIHDAAKLAGAPLAMLASPWSPPMWMKTKMEFHGDGHLKKECYGAWAHHFVRFVQEMEKLDVPIWAVSVQNEPEAAQIWESCIYTAEEERDFVRDHLGPALEAADLSRVKIIIWDHNRDGMLERAAVAYADVEASKYIWGLGYHWYGDARYETWPECYDIVYEDRKRGGGSVQELKARLGFENVRRLAELQPDKHIIFTEGCQELSNRKLDEMLGVWKIGERYGMNIINDMNHGCEGWIDWNLCLDERGGPNHVGNFCSAPIICDTRSDEVLRQPSYWYLGHFSRYIRPGACRAVSSTSRDVLEVTSWVNPDGSLAVVVMNQSAEDIEFWLKVQGSGAVRTEAPARSITTYLVDDVEPADV